MLSRLKEIYAAYRPQQRHKFDVGCRYKKRSHSTLVRRQKDSSKSCTGGSVTGASHIATNPLL
jgi:hypothetical protein